MMRALAEFIMRGRMQAGIVALFNLVVPLFPLAAVALVTLRQGIAEGFLMVLVGLIPPVLLTIVGAAQAHVVLGGAVLGLLMAYVPAVVLRVTVSLSSAIMACLLTALGLVILTVWLLPDVALDFKGVATAFQGVSSGEVPVAADQAALTISTLSGFMALAFLLNGLSSLIVARWWQSLLYNPEGFGQEFRSLQLGRSLTLILALLAVLLYLQGPGYGLWALLCLLPLVLVAIAIVHSAMKFYRLNGVWLAIFYGLLIMLSPIILLLAILGLADSWLNIRSRFVRKE